MDTASTPLHVIFETGAVEAGALLIAAAAGAMIGAWLQRRSTREGALELERIERRQGALLELLDYLAAVLLATEKSLNEDPPQSIIWVPAAEGIPSEMVREFLSARSFPYLPEGDDAVAPAAIIGGCDRRALAPVCP